MLLSEHHTRKSLKEKVILRENRQAREETLREKKGLRLIYEGSC